MADGKDVLVSAIALSKKIRQQRPYMQYLPHSA